MSIKFKHIDLLTAKKEDLTFIAPFELTARRDDCEHLRELCADLDQPQRIRRSCIPGMVRHLIRVDT